ncbi:hypothetical protein WJX81_001480 [Elliptochloris bilobata]|uniref:Inositol-pentakisphosphate 2-kinase n=1 Tax=Elliptochloris bilobata TaxID=381761 RepID=A0AAW1QVG2_9CHLO
MTNLGEHQDWPLAGEGRAHAVFAYSGALPHLEGKVLRVKKLQHMPGSNERLARVERQVWAGLPLHDPVLCEAAFADRIMRPLLGNAHLLPLHRAVLRYTLHQRLKLAQGQIKRESAYDPRDLFSGEPQRMAAAMRALLADPQNNLRLFWRGERLPLAHGGPGAAKAAAPKLKQMSGLDGLVDVLVAVLRAEGVLEPVLAVQRLDTLDAEGAHALLGELLQRGDAPAPGAALDSAAAPLGSGGAPDRAAPGAAPGAGAPGGLAARAGPGVASRTRAQAAG